MDRTLILSLLVIVHLAAAVVHGYSHAIVPVELSLALNTVVLLTVFIGPVVGVILVRRDHAAGFPIFTVSMVGAFLIGGMLHFLVENPDHISRLPATYAGQLFELSAIFILVTPAIGAIYGGYHWRIEGS